MMVSPRLMHDQHIHAIAQTQGAPTPPTRPCSTSASAPSIWLLNGDRATLDLQGRFFTAAISPLVTSRIVPGCCGSSTMARLNA